MTGEHQWRDVEDLLASLEGVRLHQDPRGRRWCVRGRLVARQVDDATLLVRATPERREALLGRWPTTFSVRPELEAHAKVLADVVEGDLDAVRSSLREVWELQRGGA